jgi:hypothetical protein
MARHRRRPIRRSPDPTPDQTVRPRRERFDPRLGFIVPEFDSFDRDFEDRNPRPATSGPEYDAWLWAREDAREALVEKHCPGAVDYSVPRRLPADVRPRPMRRR